MTAKARRYFAKVSADGVDKYNIIVNRVASMNITPNNTNRPNTSMAKKPSATTKVRKAKAFNPEEETSEETKYSSTRNKQQIDTPDSLDDEPEQVGQNAEKQSKQNSMRQNEKRPTPHPKEISEYIKLSHAEDFLVSNSNAGDQLDTDI